MSNPNWWVCIFYVISTVIYIYIMSTVAAPQLMSVVLASFRNGTFQLSLQYDQQVGRHAVYMNTLVN